MGVLIAVARADMILATAGRVLKCLLAGAISWAAMNALWIGLRMIFGRDKP